MFKMSHKKAVVVIAMSLITDMKKRSLGVGVHSVSPVRTEPAGLLLD